MDTFFKRLFGKAQKVNWAKAVIADKGGRGVGEMLTLVDKGGRAVWIPTFVADIICEQLPLFIMIAS